jgi:hypothetical protein
MKDLQAEQDKTEVDRIDTMVNELLRTYNSVTILVTRQMTPEDVSIGRNPEDTRSIVRGAGDWYARYGHVKIWLEKAEEEEREHTRGNNGV